MISTSQTVDQLEVYRENQRKRKLRNSLSLQRGLTLIGSDCGAIYAKEHFQTLTCTCVHMHMHTHTETHTHKHTHTAVT